MSSVPLAVLLLGVVVAVALGASGVLPSHWNGFLNVESGVAVVRWDSLTDAVNKKGLNLREPCLIRGRFMEDLAVFHWSVEEIVAAATRSVVVREQMSRPLFGYVTEDGTKLPLSPLFLPLFQSNTTRVTTSELLKAPPVPNTHRYLSVHLDDFSPDLARNFPSHLLYLHDPGVNIQEGIAPTSYVWIGQGAGTTAALHYDGNHNIYLQMKGEKEFLLFSPSDLGSIALFPYLSSLARQSSIEWIQGAGPSRNFSCRLLTLRPGDALYLPPFWAHRVLLKTDWSISINVWTDCRAQFVHDVELFKLPLPFEEHWSYQEKALVWGKLFGPRVYNGSDWPRFFHHHIAIPYSFQSTHQGACDSKGYHQGGGEEENTSFDFVDSSKLDRYTARIRVFLETLDPYDVLVASYLELTLFNVFGSLNCVPHAVSSIAHILGNGG